MRLRPIVLYWLVVGVGIVVLLTTCSACSGEVIIDGPSEVDPGTPTFYFIKGIPDEHAKTTNAVLFPKPAKNTQFMTFYSGDGSPILFFWSKAKGKFAIILDVNIPNAYQLVLQEIQVGEGDNPPDPGPDPDPEPDPNQKYQVMIFVESSQLDNLSAAQREICSSLKLRQAINTAGHNFRGCFDVDLTARDKLPEIYKPWWDTIQGDTLPRIALAPKDGGTIRDFPLPADAAGLWKLLGEGN